MVKPSAKSSARAGAAKSTRKPKHHHKPIKPIAHRAEKREKKHAPHHSNERSNGKPHTPPISQAESKKLADQLLQVTARFSTAQIEITAQNGQAAPAHNGKPENGNG